MTYTGHELIAGAGLINMGARLYDPATGLFMSPDPIIAYPYDSQDLNQYAYVNDNPLTYTDPTGLVTILSKIYVQGYCGIYCVAGMMGDGMLQLYMTGGRGPGMGGGGGGGSGTTAHSKQSKCTAARQAAAQLAKSLEHVSTVSATLAAVSGVGTVVSGAGEGPTFGFDTPVTVAFGSMTTFFTGTSFTAGTLAAGLNSFASGNVNALRNFDVSHLAGIAAASAASKIPGVGAWAETVGRLTEQAAGLKATAQEACH